MTAPAYLDLAGFKDLTVMPPEDVDDLEARYPGFIDRQCYSISRRLDVILRKRCVVPFTAPFPEVLLDWIQRIVTPRAYYRRGVNPSDEQFKSAVDDATAAWAEANQAADPKESGYDLPVDDSADPSAITKAGPLATSQASPYDWIDDQVFSQ